MEPTTPLVLTGPEIEYLSAGTAGQPALLAAMGREPAAGQESLRDAFASLYARGLIAVDGDDVRYDTAVVHIVELLAQADGFLGLSVITDSAIVGSIIGYDTELRPTVLMTGRGFGCFSFNPSTTDSLRPILIDAIAGAPANNEVAAVAIIDRSKTGPSRPDNPAGGATGVVYTRNPQPDEPALGFWDRGELTVSNEDPESVVDHFLSALAADGVPTR